MIGNMVTSNSCMGTCLILSMARQPKATDAASALGADGRTRVDRAARSVDSETTAGSAAVVVGVVVLIGAPFGRRAMSNRPFEPSSALCSWFARCARSRRVLLGVVVGVLLGRVAGERQEHLVQARLAEGEVGDRD